MSEESIQCWSCGARMPLDELASNDGDCPECSSEIALAEYLAKALADNKALRTQLASTGGEAVEVVAYRVSLPSEPELGHWFDEQAEEEPQMCMHEPLMTVAQHNRIFAAMQTALAGVVVSVPVKLLRNIEQSWRIPDGCPAMVREEVADIISEGLAELRALLNQAGGE